MLQTKPTEHLSGITIQGDYNDFYDLVDSIHNIVGDDDDQDMPYFGVQNRLLGLCYDIRRAYQGDRDILFVDNGLNDVIMQQHDIAAPGQSIYYSVNVLFPEAIFVALSVPRLYASASQHYGRRTGLNEAEPNRQPYAAYIRDKANLNVLFAGIWQALGSVIGDVELENLMRAYRRSDEYYASYVTHYVDKCNLELLKTPAEKRPAKLRNISKRLIKKPDAYYRLEQKLQAVAEYWDDSIYNLVVPRLQYSGEIEW